MHEYSLTQSIIEILNDVIKKEKIKKIKQIDFLLGAFANIEPDSIRFYYDFLSKDNPVLKKAKLVFNKSPINYYCRHCKKYFSTDSKDLKCIYCASKDISMKDTEDIKIISIET
jgi:hydrogenase nickel incorporation protein HypA/HybF